MNRKDFIKTCGGACLGVIGLGLLVESCKPMQYAQSTIVNNKLQINKSNFIITKEDKISYRRSVIVKSENLDFPIVVYRFSETEYSALLLKCSHQGSELSANGDILTCASHGSEFSNKGIPLQGPADQNLQSFKVTTDETNIFIQLT